MPNLKNKKGKKEVSLSWHLLYPYLVAMTIPDCFTFSSSIHLLFSLSIREMVTMGAICLQKSSTGETQLIHVSRWCLLFKKIIKFLLLYEIFYIYIYNHIFIYYLFILIYFGYILNIYILYIFKIYIIKCRK